jgi:phosphoglycerate kinase
MEKLSVNGLNVKNQRVLVRVDYNVPMEEKDGKMIINDDTRIKETLPTLRLLIENGAKIILAAHLGRPKGKREPSMSLRPVAEKLSAMLGRPLAFADDCIGESAEKAVASLKPGDILLLENVRFYNEEEANDPAFAEKLARLADLYVNDAFGAAHRAHASTEGVARVIARRGGQCAAGLLMERELQYLGRELEKPARPFVVILGGAKVSDKIKVIDRLLDKADTILIGGAMAYTFKLAQGFKVGKSLSEPDKQDVARAAMEKAKARNVQFLLPSDNIIGTPVDTGKLNKKGRPIIDIQNLRRKDWTLDRTRPGVSAKSYFRPRPLYGTARWACSRTRALPGAPTPSPVRWRKQRPSTAPRALLAAETASRRSTRPASATKSLL